MYSALVAEDLSGEPQEISFHQAGKEVMKITADGRLEFGDGLSRGEATQATAKILKQLFDEMTRKP